MNPHNQFISTRRSFIGAAAARNDAILELIRKDCIVPEPVEGSKTAVIRQLSERLVAGHSSLDSAVVARTLLDREALATTGVGGGVAIPHGRMIDMAEPVVCLARSRRGVDFAAVDGEPTFLFVALLSPRASMLHLKVLACTLRLFADPGFRARLRAARGVDGMYDVLATEAAAGG